VLFAVVPRDRPALQRTIDERAECQVLIVGPSYVQAGIFPPLFDAEARRIGLNLRSCKYAEGSLAGFELEYVLGRLLAKPWPKLEHLIVDVTLGQGSAFERENWFKRRPIDWHTWGAIPWLIAHDRPGRKGRAAPALELWAHAQHVALNYLGVGRGIPLLEKLRFSSADEPAPALELTSMAHSPAHPPTKRRGYAEELRQLTASKARVRAEPTGGSDAWPRELLRFVRAHGVARAIFLISPVLSTRRPVEGAGADPDGLVVFDFEDPTRYPELYSEDVRGRTSHLKGRGPGLYSALLAQRLLEFRRAQ